MVLSKLSVLQQLPVCTFMFFGFSERTLKALELQGVVPDKKPIKTEVFI